MSVGDVNSTERGSGARFNDGKIMMEYVPASVLFRFFNVAKGGDAVPWNDACAINILKYLGDFEQGDIKGIIDLFKAIPEEHRWRSTCEQFDFGAKKYAAWNWAKGMNWSIPIACIKRHAMAILEGELIDPESDISHFGAIGCNAVMLIHYTYYFKEGDDRPPSNLFEIGEDNTKITHNKPIHDMPITYTRDIDWARNLLVG